jgi:hippurate hydrolase
MHKHLLGAAILALVLPASAAEYTGAIAKDYDSHLAPLFDHFHRNPELSMLESKTAARLAAELRAAGFTVTEGVGGTGVVALLKNGPGPTVLMRADMDGLPVQEKSGLANASTATQKDMEGNLVPVMHACGHDVHITSLVGTARLMAARRGDWSGTLMLVGQPGEERGLGAAAMMKDGLLKRFGKPDFALAFHVNAQQEAGKINALEGSPYSGVDTVEILVRGVGAHGASPHTGRDPVVIGSMIVLGLQTIVSRELAPREPGLITDGSFHAGSKANIIGDSAKLQLTVRSESAATRELLLGAIKRMAENTARAAGVDEQHLPEVKLVDLPVPPTLNDVPLTKRLKAAWARKLGAEAFAPDRFRPGMGGEDFPYFTTDPYIPSVYFTVGGTPEADVKAAQEGKLALASHHSPLFKIQPAPAIKAGVEATVVALLELMPRGGR